MLGFVKEQHILGCDSWMLPDSGLETQKVVGHVVLSEDIL